MVDETMNEILGEEKVMQILEQSAITGDGRLKT